MSFYNQQHQTFYQIKQAYLSLKQKPGFVFSVVTTMGVTLGALLCVLTLAYVVLIKPLPYPEQDKLTVVEYQNLDKNGDFHLAGFDYPTIVGFYQQQTQFTKSAISYHSEEVIRSHPKQSLVKTAFVTPQWFSLLAVPMKLGRAFNATEDINTTMPVAVISFKTWQQDYAGDPNIINRKINVNDVSYKIIGVIDNDFIDPQLNKSGLDSQLYLPWDFNSISYQKDWWGSYSSKLIFLGQLSDSLSVNQGIEQSKNLICNIIQPLVAEGDVDACARFDLAFKSIKTTMVGDTDYIMYLLLAAVIALLMLAATNIINLFIAHTAQQQQNLAINAALGAKKQQLFIQLFAQASLLMIAAMFVSVFIASIGFTVVATFLQAVFPLVNQLNLHTEIIILLFVFSCILALVFAKFSINTINYKQLNSSLDSSGKGAGIQVSAKLRHVLIVSQIAVVGLLVFCSINLMLNAFKTITKPLGYQHNNLSYLSLSISSVNNENTSFEKDFALINQVKASLLNLAEIEAIATAESPIGSFMKLSVKDTKTELKYLIDTSFGDEKYFDIIGQQFIAGDNFPIQNKQYRDNLLVVNDVFANKLSQTTPLNSDDVIGRKFDLSDDGSNIFTVIGIVKGILEPGQSTIPPRMYAPSSTLAPKFLIRFKLGQTITREQLIAKLKSVSSLLAISQYKSLDDTYKWVVLPERITLVSSIAMTIISLFLAAIGLYGILSYSTQMRRFEIGTRMAIGATRSAVIRMIISDNAKAILTGISISVVILCGLFIRFSDLLDEYLSWQLLLLFIITLGLISAISFAACYLPLRQYINKSVINSLRGAE